MCLEVAVLGFMGFGLVWGLVLGFGALGVKGLIVEGLGGFQAYRTLGIQVLWFWGVFFNRENES